MMTSSFASPSEQELEPRSVLAQACTLRSAGLHGQAITRLDEAMRSPLQHDDVFAAMALALKARSQIQLMHDADATVTIALVPTAVRRLNPKVDTYCHIVSGLVSRRRAYRRWKAGSPDLRAVRAAADSFAHAQRAAESGIEHRLASVAELNRLYAIGLEAAVVSQRMV